MISATEREQAIAGAERTIERGDLPAGETWLARCLLAEHGEVLASRDKIREQGDTIERMTASSLDNARRFASDIAAERMAGTLRVAAIRAAILDGATDSAQTSARADALYAVENWPPHYRGSYIARAYLAQGEALREARADIARMREAAREMAEP